MVLKSFVLYFESDLFPDGVIETFATYSEALQVQSYLSVLGVSSSQIFDRDIFLRYGARFSSLRVGSPVTEKVRSIS